MRCSRKIKMLFGRLSSSHNLHSVEVVDLKKYQTSVHFVVMTFQIKM
jgi:hypothetical protein